MRKTKIVCTLGPSTTDEQILKKLMLCGMDVARVNFSHGDHAAHLEMINKFKSVRDELNLPIALIADTRGPEIRTGVFAEKVRLEAGQDYLLTTRECEGTNEHCQISFDRLPADVKRGTKILLDDGLIELVVESTTDTDISCTVVNGGELSSKKGVNVPGVKLSMPFISSRDRADIRFAVENDFDFIAASFTRTAEDILMIREELNRLGDTQLGIIAKIENADGVANIDQILQVSDGIMVARGDMGVEIPLEEIPIIQKMLIKKSYKAGKSVITATQMLESMIKNPRPTRAETTDVANAIYDGTSAIMLSGETAAGMWPIEAVKTMSTIALRAERSINYRKRFENMEPEETQNVTYAISHAACTTAHDLAAVAILTVTKSGTTAKMISKNRPAMTIIGCTTEPRVRRQLNLSWGVKPLIISEQSNTDELFIAATNAARTEKLLTEGDLVVITAGVPVGMSGKTNLLKVHVIGDQLSDLK